MAEQLWVIRAGQGARYVGDFLSAGIIAVGFSELVSKDRAAVKRETLKARSAIPANRTHAGQLSAFAFGVDVADLVIVPRLPKARDYLVGRVTSPYRHVVDAPLLGHHQRSVEWLGTFDREFLSPAAINTLAEPQIIFRPTAVEAELRSLVRELKPLVQDGRQDRMDFRAVKTGTSAESPPSPSMVSDPNSLMQCPVCRRQVGVESGLLAAHVTNGSRCVGSVTHPSASSQFPQPTVSQPLGTAWIVCAVLCILAVWTAGIWVVRGSIFWEVVLSLTVASMARWVYVRFFESPEQLKEWVERRRRAAARRKSEQQAALIAKSQNVEKSARPVQARVEEPAQTRRQKLEAKRQSVRDDVEQYLQKLPPLGSSVEAAIDALLVASALNPGVADLHRPTFVALAIKFARPDERLVGIYVKTRYSSNSARVSYPVIAVAFTHGFGVKCGSRTFRTDLASAHPRYDSSDHDFWLGEAYLQITASVRLGEEICSEVHEYKKQEGLSDLYLMIAAQTKLAARANLVAIPFN